MYHPHEPLPCFLGLSNTKYQLRTSQSFGKVQIIKQGARMAWYGNSQGHAKAGRLGGKSQGKTNNPGNFANDPQKARRAGRKGGSSKRA
jgi:general stress protein YciG